MLVTSLLFELASVIPTSIRGHILSSVGLVVHEEKIDIARVVDKEGLVAGGHQVTGFLV